MTLKAAPERQALGLGSSGSIARAVLDLPVEILDPGLGDLLEPGLDLAGLVVADREPALAIVERLAGRRDPMQKTGGRAQLAPCHEGEGRIALIISTSEIAGLKFCPISSFRLDASGRWQKPIS